MTDPTRNGAGDEDLLAGYVAEGLERLERGECVDAEALCAEHPRLARPVAEALGLAPRLSGLHREARRGDHRIDSELQGRYRLCERIGAGAMGTVYRALDLELGRPVAVKVLQAGLFAGTRAVERFLREAEVLASIDHPHVVRVYDRGRADDDTLFLVMELLSGASLSAVLAWSAEAMPDGPSAVAFADPAWLEARLPSAAHRLESSYLRQVVVWCQQLAAGLEGAHARGVFHRDVKPSNVFIGQDGRAVLLDFGIAARAGDGQLTATGTSIGTPWYMPPEVAAGDRTPDARTDGYSLAATLYHLLTLRPPYDGDVTRVLAQLRFEDPVPADRLHRGLPRDLEAVLEKGMEKDPKRRYPSMTALAADLGAFLEHRPVSVRPLGPLGRAWRRARRRPWRSTALGAAALALCLVLVAVPLYLRVARQEARRMHDELAATLPALLSLESYPEKRLLVDPLERGELVALLDEVLRLDPDDAANRLVRAALRLDAGDRDGAAQDLAAIAAQAPLPSPYLAAVAARYAAADPSQRGLQAIDLAELPEPDASSATDCLVAGFHALRVRTAAGYREALRYLDAAGDDLPARDLLLIALLANRRYQAAHDAALVLEGRYGRQTARTRHVIGAACVALGRYQDAMLPLEQSIALRPGRHGPIHNLGIARFRLGEVGPALELFEEAHRIRPWLWNTLEMLSQVQCQRGEFDAAWRSACAIPAEGELGEVWRRPWVMAHVKLWQAFARLDRDEPEAARAPARAARELLAASAQNGAPGKFGTSAPALGALCEAIAAGDWTAALQRFVDELGADPANPKNVRNLAALLPEGAGMDAAEVELLRIYLLELCTALAPGDPTPAIEARKRRAALAVDAGYQQTTRGK